MGIIATATSYKPIPAATYRGRLTKVETKDNDNGEYWLWTFRLIEDVEGEPVDEDNEVFKQSSSTSFTTNAKARKWVNGMLGRVIDDDEQVDFDRDLVGPMYLLTIGINENNKNVLNGVTPSKKAKSAPDKPATISQRMSSARKALGWADAQFKLWYSMNTSDNGQTRFAELLEELQTELVEKLEAQVAPVSDIDDLPF